MLVRSWLTGAVVCVMFAQSVSSLSYEDKQRRQTTDMGLPFQGSVSYSVILSALSGLRRTRKRTAMGMDLTDYLWNKAHEKSRAMVLQRMMKNGKRLFLHTVNCSDLGQFSTLHLHFEHFPSEFRKKKNCPICKTINGFFSRKV